MIWKSILPAAADLNVIDKSPAFLPDLVRFNVALFVADEFCNRRICVSAMKILKL